MTTTILNTVFQIFRRCLVVIFLGIILLMCCNFNSTVSAVSPENYVFMMPAMHVAREAGETFNISICISCEQQLYKACLTIAYNSYYLEIMEVSQGTFFPSPPDASFDFKDYKIASLIDINISLVNLQKTLIGNGTLALISFRVIQESQECLSIPIQFVKTSLFSTSNTPIDNDFVDAVFFWRSALSDPDGGRLLDVYTQKGGEGIEQPGGVFIPAEEVNLITEVLYNDAPVQHKLVAFQVLNPSGLTVVMRVAKTNSKGIAEISFRIPNLEDSYGRWIVFSTVDIAEKAVWDKLAFNVYLKIPVGGYSISIRNYTNEKSLIVYLIFIAILIVGFVATERKVQRS